MCVGGSMYVCICISERQTHVLYVAVFLSVCNMCYCAGVPTANGTTSLVATRWLIP